MPTEVQYPDAIVSSANYTTLNVADIDDPGWTSTADDDNVWGTWDGNGNTDCLVSFPTPSGNPTAGAGLQTLRALVRKNGGGATTTYSLELWEGGALVSVLATGTVTSTSGEVISGTWNATSLGTADGSAVECKVLQTGGGTGGGRAGIEVGAVAWDVTYTAAAKELAGTTTAVSSITSAALKRTRGVAATTVALSSIPTAALQRSRNVDGGVSAALSTVPSPVLGRTRAIDGALTTAVSTVVSAEMQRIKNLDSVATALSAVASVDFTRSRDLDGGVATALSTAASALLERWRENDALVSALSSVPSADLTVTAGAVELEGVTVALSSVVPSPVQISRAFLATTVALSVVASAEMTVATTVELAGTTTATSGGTVWAFYSGPFVDGYPTRTNYKGTRLARVTRDWLLRQAGTKLFFNPGFDNNWQNQVKDGLYIYTQSAEFGTPTLPTGWLFDATLEGGTWLLGPPDDAGPGGFGILATDFDFSTGGTIGEPVLQGQLTEGGVVPLKMVFHIPIQSFGTQSSYQEVQFWLDPNPTPDDLSAYNNPPQLTSPPTPGYRGEILLFTKRIYTAAADDPEVVAMAVANGYPDSNAGAYDFLSAETVVQYVEIPVPQNHVALIRQLITGDATWQGRMAIITMAIGNPVPRFDASWKYWDIFGSPNSPIWHNRGALPLFLRVTQEVPEKGRGLNLANSDVEIVNIALMKLGTTPIGSFSEDSRGARLARTSYQDTLDAILRAHPWNFAIRRAELPVATPSPLWGYDFAYDIPESNGKCLRVLEVNGEDPNVGTWRVEGRQLLTDLEAPIQIRYIARETAVTKYDSLFVEALAARLAAIWAESFGRDTAWSNQKWAEYKAAIQEAWTADGQEQLGSELEATTWINAR